MIGWGHMGSGGLAMALVWVVVVALVVAAVVGVVAVVESASRREPGTPERASRPHSLAEDEIELRYARGEIDAETLARQRAVLRHY